MNRINRYINLIFCWGWALYLLLFIVFCGYNYIKYETLPVAYKSLYVLCIGLLLCSFLGQVKIKYFRSAIFLIFIYFMLTYVYTFPERNFVYEVEDCYETQNCDNLIKNEYLQIKDNEYIWLKKYKNGKF